MAAPRRAIRLVLGVLAAFVIGAGMAAPAGASSPAPAPAPAPGGIGLRLLDAPVSGADDPRARVYIVDHLSPGTVIARRIEVSNTTGSTAHVVLYPGAASISGGSFVGAEGGTLNDLTTWTSVSPAESDVPAGGTATATVTISVPGDAAPGEQYGVVWAEVRSDPVAGGGVVQVSRVGIRLYVSIGPGGPPPADFTIESLTAERSPEGQPTVVATVRNTGGRALDMSGTLQLSAGPGGLSAGPFPATLGSTLGIGDTEAVRIALDGQLPAGPWDAQIILRSGLLERTAQATITFPDSGQAAPVGTTSGRPWWLYPGIAGLLLLLGIAAMLLVVRRRAGPPNLPSRHRGGRTGRRVRLSTG